jgi:hypothetical protein
VAVLAIQLNTVAHPARTFTKHPGASRTSDFDLVVHFSTPLPTRIVALCIDIVALIRLPVIRRPARQRDLAQRISTLKRLVELGLVEMKNPCSRAKARKPSGKAPALVRTGSAAARSAIT